MHPFLDIYAYTQRVCAGERGEREKRKEEKKGEEKRGEEKKKEEKKRSEKEREEIIFLPDRKLTAKEGL